MSTRRLASNSLKITVSVVFLVYLFNAVSWTEVWAHATEADPFYLTLYVILSFAGVLVSSIKWLVLARSRRMSAALSYMVCLYLVGSFFNNFLPTSIGGDFVRGHALGTAYKMRPEAMASVFMERFTGFTALVVFALVALAFDSALRTDLRLVAPIAFAVLVYIGVVAAVTSSKWLDLAEQWMPGRLVRKILLKVGAFQQAIWMYRHEPAALWWAGGYSIVFYLFSVLVVYTGCLTFRVSVAFTSLLSAVPVLLILFMIPFSFGGIGLQEWAYFFVLEAVGVPASVGLSLGLLFRVRSVVFGLVGGAVYPFIIRGKLLPDPSPSSNLPNRKGSV